MRSGFFCLLLFMVSVLAFTEPVPREGYLVIDNHITITVDRNLAMTPKSVVDQTQVRVTSTINFNLTCPKIVSLRNGAYTVNSAVKIIWNDDEWRTQTSGSNWILSNLPKGEYGANPSPRKKDRGHIDLTTQVFPGDLGVPAGTYTGTIILTVAPHDGCW